jgi:hypothetical protein
MRDAKLKQILDKWNMRPWIGFIRNCAVAGFYEHGDDPSGSIKCGEFLDYLSDYQLLNESSAPWS